MWRRGRTWLVHRLTYDLLVAPIPTGVGAGSPLSGTSLRHPAHLEPVTHKENILRGFSPQVAENARKTHCVNGHEFTGREHIPPRWRPPAVSSLQRRAGPQVPRKEGGVMGEGPARAQLIEAQQQRDRAITRRTRRSSAAIAEANRPPCAAAVAGRPGRPPCAPVARRGCPGGRPVSLRRHPRTGRPRVRRRAVRGRMTLWIWAGDPPGGVTTGTPTDQDRWDVLTPTGASPTRRRRVVMAIHPNDVDPPSCPATRTRSPVVNPAVPAVRWGRAPSNDSPASSRPRMKDSGTDPGARSKATRATQLPPKTSSGPGGDPRRHWPGEPWTDHPVRDRRSSLPSAQNDALPTVTAIRLVRYGQERPRRQRPRHRPGQPSSWRTVARGWQSTWSVGRHACMAATRRSDDQAATREPPGASPTTAAAISRRRGPRDARVRLGRPPGRRRGRCLGRTTAARIALVVRMATATEEEVAADHPRRGAPPNSTPSPPSSGAVRLQGVASTSSPPSAA